MPLPKDLRKTLQGLLKDGASLPDELDDCVYFPNDGAFLSAAEQKNKAKLTAAEQKAADSEKSAKDMEAKLAEALAGIGVDDVGKIEEFKAKLAAANGTLTEFDKLKSEHTKVTKERDTLKKDNERLTGFETTVKKDKALSPHLAKIHPDFRDLFSENVLGKLAIDDKGNVTAPEGKAIDAFVDEFIKAKPSLRAPDYKAGAGTGQGGDKGAGANGAAGGGAGNGTANGSNGQPKPKSIGEAIVQQLTAAEAAKTAALSGP